MRRKGVLAIGVLVAAAIAAPANADASSTPTAAKSVIGGQTASVLDYPYAAMIFERGEGYICSGTVIAPTKVLTAAHCARGDQSRLSVLTGSSSDRDGGGLASGVSAVAIHPGFSKTRGGALINDVAVLTLAFSTPVTPAPLPTPSEDAVLAQTGAAMTLVAFGERRKDFRGKSRVGTLAAAQLFARTSCDGRYPGFALTTMICASGKKFVTAFSGRKRRAVTRSACFGDSGGPLIGYTATGPRILGVVSYGPASPRRFFFVRCGLRRYPGAFTRVSAYLPFIQAAVAS